MDAKPVDEEPVSKEPVGEEPVSEEPVSKEPVDEEPVSEEPVSEEPVGEEPVGLNCELVISIMFSQHDGTKPRCVNDGQQEQHKPRCMDDGSVDSWNATNSSTPARHTKKHARNHHNRERKHDRLGITVSVEFRARKE